MTDTWRMRPAEPGDAEQILAVSDEATEWLAGHGLSGQWGDELPSSEASFVSRVSGWIRDGEATVAVDVAGDVHGYMVFGRFPPPYLDPDVAERAVEDAAYVYTLASRMKPESRGVGRELIAWATGWARSCGVTYLRLDCWADNAALRAYYEDLGFAECDAYTDDGWRGIVMQLRV
jgi:GNAT superfamily N-acetyltransferase